MRLALLSWPSLIAFLALTFAAGPAPSARAQVLSVTVGLDPSCPYGLPA